MYSVFVVVVVVVAHVCKQCVARPQSLIVAVNVLAVIVASCLTAVYFTFIHFVLSRLPSAHK